MRALGLTKFDARDLRARLDSADVGAPIAPDEAVGTRSDGS
jgi:hypothetical protein